MATATRLLDLPPELLERIAQFAPEADLFALRLTSRQLAARTIDTFKHTYFENRSILLCSEDSIQHALMVAAHPTFGRVMRRLNIFLDEVPDQDVVVRRIDASDHAKIQLIARAYAEQEALRSTEKDLDLLSTLFSRLRGCGAKTVMAFTDENRSKVWEEGDRRDAPRPKFKSGRDILEMLRSPWHTSNMPFNVVIEAIWMSGLSPISICFLGRPNLHPGVLSEEDLNMYAAVFTKLSDSLNLSMISYGENYQVAVKELCKALGRASKLKVVTMTTTRNSHPFLGDKPEFCQHLAQCVLTEHFEALRVLNICGVQVTLSELVDFIGRHSTLLGLNVVHSAVVDDMQHETWKDRESAASKEEDQASVHADQDETNDAQDEVDNAGIGEDGYDGETNEENDDEENDSEEGTM